MPSLLPGKIRSNLSRLLAAGIGLLLTISWGFAQEPVEAPTEPDAPADAVSPEEEVAPTIPDELLEDEHLREEMGVNQFTTPSIRRIFEDLRALRPLPYEELKRPLPGQTPVDRTRLALTVGVLMADGFFAVEAEQFFDLEPVGRALLTHAKALG